MLMWLCAARREDEDDAMAPIGSLSRGRDVAGEGRGRRALWVVSFEAFVSPSRVDLPLRRRDSGAMDDAFAAVVNKSRCDSKWGTVCPVKLFRLRKCEVDRFQVLWVLVGRLMVRSLTHEVCRDCGNKQLGEFDGP